MKVEVTNVDEDGTVELSALQPAPSVAFTATLTDLDNGTVYRLDQQRRVAVVQVYAHIRWLDRHRQGHGELLHTR